MHLIRSGALALVALASLSLAAWAQSRDNPDPPPVTPKAQPPANNPPNIVIPEPNPNQQPNANPQPGQNPTPMQRGYLGVMVGPENQNQPGNAIGIEVMDVLANSPAAKAGLQKGDHITKIGDHAVADVPQFLQAIAAHKPGDKISVEVTRNGKPESIAVNVGERPANLASGPQPLPNAFPRYPGTDPQFPGSFPQTNFRQSAFIGVQAQPITPQVKERLKLNSDAGVVVTEVVPNSPAAQAGLKTDDVITVVNDQPVKTPDDLRNAIQTAGTGKEITIQVMRGTQKTPLKVTPRDSASGFFPMQGYDRIPPTNLGGYQDQTQQIQELQRRVAELEKKIQQLEKK